MFATQANLRALGFNMGTSSDGTISINTSLTNLTRTSINRSKYDLAAVAAHEIDEILGMGSGLNIPAQYGGYIMPQDLFRYSNTAGRRSYTSSSTALSYFSIDGANRIVQLNQNSSGDYIFHVEGHIFIVSVTDRHSTCRHPNNIRMNRLFKQIKS